MSYLSDCRYANCSTPSCRVGVTRVRGFTLIEIMVVVVIIGLLAAVVVPEVIGQVERARITKAKQDIQSFETALALFQLDNSKYPTSDQGLAALVQQPTDPLIRHWRT